GRRDETWTREGPIPHRRAVWYPRRRKHRCATLFDVIDRYWLWPATHSNGDVGVMAYAKTCRYSCQNNFWRNWFVCICGLKRLRAKTPLRKPAKSKRSLRVGTLSTRRVLELSPMLLPCPFQQPQRQRQRPTVTDVYERHN